MPRLSSSNNPHVATTNHRIPRHADRESQSPVRNEPPGSRRGSLVNFHRALMEKDDLARAERDRGIVLCRTAGDGALAEALPLLKSALEKQPDDLPARECLGEALGRLGRPEEGLAAYRLVLSQEPARQTALEGAAHLAAQASRPRDAVKYWQHAIAVNPWRSAYFAELARVELRLRDWSAAADACQQSLRLNPSSVQVRKWLVQCNLHLGDQDAARREFEILLGFDPPDRDALIRWFTPLAPKQDAR
jgi:tetratricopeptide (TPR) repeat protein